MWKSLRTCAGCAGSCRSYLSKLWAVCRSNWGAILIYAFDCDWIWVSNKLFIWSESYSSVWCNRVSSLTWNRFLFASIFEGWLNCFIDWNQWITTLEGWSTSLWKSLRTCAGCTGSCRSDLSKLWAVSRSNFCTVLIHAFNRYWVWFAYKLLVWSEGYCSVWRNRVSSLTWNRLLFASIFEGWLDCFIDRNQWIATLEGWSTSLRKSLRTCAGCVSAGWDYLSHCWCISCGNFCTILIHSFHCDWIWCTNILFVWRKGNRAIWIDAVFTYTRNSLR